MDTLAWVARELLSSGHGTDTATDSGHGTDTSGGHDSSHDAVAHNVTLLIAPPHAGGHAGPTDTSQQITGIDGWIAIPAGDCYCAGWYVSHGSSFEATFAHVCQWSIFAVCVLSLLWYAYQYWKATCGWEEVYVCCIELVFICFELYHEFDSPCSLYLSTSNVVNWLRYSEWLLCCPVILIHLSNVTGLSDDYGRRTMGLLVSDIATIVFGVTAAMLVNWPKIIFYLIGFTMCCYTFFLAAKVLIESFHQVPKGICRHLVKAMAITYFVGWSFFPLIFLFGQSGFKKISPYADVIASSFGDLISKNAFGMLGHFLRVKIHEHILKHGDIRKTTHLRIAGEEKEVETFVEEEDEDTAKHSTKELANRGSFIVMRDKMKEQGIDVRASLDMDEDEEARTGKGKGAGATSLVPGRVILAVPDISMVDFFHDHFAHLGASIELVPALGVENTLLLVQQAMQLGGLDFVLVHPEFLRDRSQNGLVSRLKMTGHGVCAFGWVPSGPMREIIESAGVDGWLDGPSFGTGIDQEQLIELIGYMQAKRKFGMRFGGGGASKAGYSSDGGFGGKGMLEMQPSMSQGSGVPLLQQNNSMMRAPPSPMGNMANNGMMNPMMSMNNPMMGGGAVMMTSMGSMQQAANPLYGAPPSPLSSQPGAGMYGAPAQPQMGSQGSMHGSMYGGSQQQHQQPQQAAAAPAAADGGSEAEMLKQLMSEINRLKAELGES
uniref:Channelopsin 1 n=1 Tax=Chlamydomonas yellowstonensis TaxID=1108652 RepID=G8HK98_9CHLO|nr:channelopsin 1 [Chlamydomonas yellowstonensis]